MTENQINPADKLDPQKPISMDELFSFSIDDVEEYLDAREKLLRADSKDKNERMKTSQFLPEIDELLSSAVSAFVANVAKYGRSKKNNVMGVRVAFELTEKKYRMMLREHLPSTIIYHIGINTMAGTVMRDKIPDIIARAMAGGNGIILPSVEDIRQIDPESLNGMPSGLRSQLLEVINELKKKLEE